MKFRTLVASVCVIGCIAAMLPPVEAVARSGGLMVGHGLAFRGAVLQPGLRRSFSFPRAPALVAKSVVTPHVVPAHVTPVRAFHRFFGARLPRNGIGVYYGAYNPEDLIGAGWQYPRMQAVADMPPLLEGDAAFGRRCGSQTVIVPAEAGGARPITVWRCRSE